MTTAHSPAPTPPARTARIEVFRPGTFTPMEGGALTYSAEDLRALAEAYDPETAPAPIVVGHPATDAPAFGWVRAFEWDAGQERLFAELHEIDPAFAEAVREGRYKKVSLSFFRPDGAANPVPGTWYPRHVGFLGAAAPAVPGLRNARFSGAPEGLATFSASLDDPAREATVGLLRSLREFLIEKFGREAAETALPSWRIDWMAEAEPMGPAYATALPNPETPVTTQPNPGPAPADPAFATREADLATREQALREREARVAHDDHAAFAARLVAEGRLLPATKDRVVALLDALPGHEAVSFAADGPKLSAGAALRQILEAQPKVVSFGRVELPAEGAASAAFAADGRAVDPEGLELHARATEYQRAHPETSYLAAVRAVRPA